MELKKEISTDRHLVKMVLNGDTRAFKIIVSNTEGLVIQIVFRMIKNSEDREDLAQEIYLKVYHKLPSFKFNSKLSTWVAAIAYNTCFNFLEKKKVPTIKLFDEEGNESWDRVDSHISNNDSSSPEEFLFRKELAHILHVEIEKLPPIYKTLITLFHSEELSYDEISKITELPEGTVKSYLYRARKKLHDNLLNTYKKSDL